VTQLPLGLTLADRVRTWAERHDGAPFWELCDAMREGATEVDAAALEVGALRWVEVGTRGRFDVCRPRVAREGEKL
jgi:hypothetical protein